LPEGRRPSAAQRSDNVITLIDVTTRINLFLLGAGLPKTSEMQAALQPHVLLILIDERLKEQAAISEGTVIPSSLVEERVGFVAGRNGMTIQQFCSIAARAVDTPHRRAELLDG
jgi:hypothetical protein